MATIADVYRLTGRGGCGTAVGCGPTWGSGYHRWAIALLLASTMTAGCGPPGSGTGGGDACSGRVDEPDEGIYVGYVMVPVGSDCPDPPRTLATLGCNPVLEWTGDVCGFVGRLDNHVVMGIPNQNMYGWPEWSFMPVSAVGVRLYPYVEEGPGNVCLYRGTFVFAGTC